MSLPSVSTVAVPGQPANFYIRDNKTGAFLYVTSNNTLVFDNKYNNATIFTNVDGNIVPANKKDHCLVKEKFLSPGGRLVLDKEDCDDRGAKFLRNNNRLVVRANPKLMIGNINNRPAYIGSDSTIRSSEAQPLRLPTMRPTTTMRATTTMRPVAQPKQLTIKDVLKSVKKNTLWCQGGVCLPPQKTSYIQLNNALLNDDVRLSGRSALRFGQDDASQPSNIRTSQISYSPQYIEIIGSGPSANNRKVLLQDNLEVSNSIAAPLISAQDISVNGTSLASRLAALENAVFQQQQILTLPPQEIQNIVEVQGDEFSPETTPVYVDLEEIQTTMPSLSRARGRVSSARASPARASPARGRAPVRRR